ncbi:MAG TPA: alcohol dehydrogenase catalytic domain-containing protein, partial [Bacilli bacterium]
MPKPETGELLIRVSVAGICGSDLGGYLGHNSLRKPPLIMGHEFSGTVAAIGVGAAEKAGKPFRIGDRVTVNPLVSCGQCDRCKESREHLCPDRKLLGAGLPGAFAEFVKVPAENVHHLPDSVS